MVIERIYRDCECIVIKIQGIDDHEFAFELQTTPSASFLIPQLKARVAKINEPGHTPPPDPMLAKYELFKQTLEGLDIGD